MALATMGKAQLQVILGWHEVSNREEDINQTHFIMDCLWNPQGVVYWLAESKYVKLKGNLLGCKRLILGEYDKWDTSGDEIFSRKGIMTSQQEKGGDPQHGRDFSKPCLIGGVLDLWIQLEENLISGARIELFIGGGMLVMQSNWVGWKRLGFAVMVSLAQLRRTKEILSRFQLP